MDFYRIKERSTKSGVIEIYPDFKVGRSKDLMVRGKSFYAIWDEERGLWSTDEYDVQRLVDADMEAYKEKLAARDRGNFQIKYMSDFSSRSWMEFRSFLNNISDSSVQLDNRLVFSNTEVKKSDYISRRLSYPLEPGSFEAYDEIIGTLYNVEERAKIEWAIGAVVSGDAKDIQKFLVFYGAAGTGKSTIINIIQKLFEGYYTTFEAKALTSSSNAFSTEVFKSNPLVAIQHDGDLSKIEDNTKLNSLISHEQMTMNEKYKPSYMARVNCFLFMGTNKPVKITDAKSGIIRRLIDVKPSGNHIPSRKYHTLVSKVDFELGAIAWHCLEVYREMGKNFYAGYRPVEMILQTDVFFNFIESYYLTFADQDGTSLAQAYEMYKTYCDDSNVEFKLARYRFREELKNYFTAFSEVTRIDGKQIRSYYSGFIKDKFKSVQIKDESVFSLVMDHSVSIIDAMFSNRPAQYATATEVPAQKWSLVSTTLADIDTSKIHYVKPQSDHIVIDFDLKDDLGEKSLERNLEAASKWPSTYAEYSKSGHGIHLHYIYEGDVTELSRVYADGIEVKVFTGDSSLRRKLTKCNNIQVATISTWLPLKEKSVITTTTIKSERSLRDQVLRNIGKEIHPGTKPSMDFIYKILEDAYASGLHYDLTDLRPKVLTFALNSTNQSDYCLKLVNRMKFQSDEPSENVEEYKEDRLVIYDLEVFPNLLVICWKFRGDKNVVRMINPTPQEVELLLSLKLLGFNNRRYDNHILYARFMGYTNAQLYALSQKIIGKSKNGFFAEAYNLSYGDIFDFLAIKDSLKKLQIELGLHHQEQAFPWDEDVPEEYWDLIAEYCENDVITTEAVLDAKEADFIARQILAELSGLTFNDTTQKHTAKIVFGSDRNPQDKFVYTDLSTMFPGYKYDFGKSTYRGEEVGEGGLVRAKPGMYTNVALLDVASMHPTSIKELNLFGPYTKKFWELVEARLAIKHGDLEKASKLLDGKLAKYLTDPGTIDSLSYALKIVINIVYGLTSAKFDNPFRDIRNVDNIVAKRGALFMLDLKAEVEARGFIAAHIKTDSIKIPDATPEIISFVMEFGEKYGYTFEHEATYDKMCLVNDAVYIAKVGWTPSGKHVGEWSAVGAQFQHPYVYKTLFSKEQVQFEDMCETKAVQTALYLDMTEALPEAEHDYHFVGRIGSFVPVIEGAGGGLLMRSKDEKYYAATGTKGYRWIESEMVKVLNKQDDIDRRYHDKLVNDAVTDISKFGDFEWFVS